MKKIKKLLEDALSSIDQDRVDAKQMFDDIANHIGQNVDRHATLGLTAAKYLEVLQRSNEQRVKLLSILSKELGDEDFGEVSDSEAEKLYEDFENLDKEAREEPKDGT